MKIAVTSQNFRTISGHAGKARRFLIFEPNPEGHPQEVGQLDLPKEQCFHEWQGLDSDPHPLDDAQVLITAGCGQGFINRMNRRNIRALITEETDPTTAVQLFLQGQLLTVSPEEAHHGHHATESVMIPISTIR